MEFPDADREYSLTSPRELFSATAMALYAIGMAILCTLYHLGAAWAVSQYKKGQLEQNPNFS